MAERSVRSVDGNTAADLTRPVYRPSLVDQTTDDVLVLREYAEADNTVSVMLVIQEQ